MTRKPIGCEPGRCGRPGTYRILLFLLSLCFCLSGAYGATEEEEYIQTLQSQAPIHEKALACQRLSVIGTKRSVPALTALLSDERLSTYSRSALEAIPGPAVGEALRNALPELEGQALIGALHSLGIRGDVASVQTLGSYLDDPNWEATEAAALSLGRIGTDRALQELMLRLDQTDEKRMAFIGDALLRCAEYRSPEDALPIYEKLRLLPLPNPQVLAALRGVALCDPKKGLRLFFEFLLDSDPDIKAMALTLAREWEGDELTAALVERMDRLPVQHQGVLMELLLDREGPLPLEVFLKALSSSSPELRLASIRALGTAGDERAVSPLLDRLYNASSEEEKRSASIALTRLRGRKVDEQLCQALEETAPVPSSLLIEVLARRQTLESIPALLELADGKDPATATESWKALGALCGSEDLSNLLALLPSCPKEAQEIAVKVLGTVALKLLEVSERAQPVEDALRTARSVETRCLLLQVLGKVGNFQSFNLLRSALDEANESVRDASLRALAGWQDATPVPVLLDVAATTSDPVHKVLALRAASRMVGMILGEGKRPSNQVMEWIQTMDAYSRTPEEARVVLSLLARAHHKDALKMALRRIEEQATQTESALAALKIAKGLAGLGGRTDAKEALRILVERMPSSAVGQQAAELLETLEAPLEHLMTWQVCGPYTEKGKQCKQLYPIAFPPEKDPGSARWQRLDANMSQGKVQPVDLASIMGGAHRAAYARTWLLSPKSQKATLELGFDDGGKAWLNGEVVCEANTDGEWAEGEHRTDVTLQEGENLLFLKLTQHSGPWQFSVKLLNEQGKPIEGIQTTLSPAGSDAVKPPRQGPPLDEKLSLHEKSFLPLFDGKSFQGWEGDEGCFQIRQGAIVAGHLDKPLERSAYLCTEETFQHFDLQAQVKTRGARVNGGVQFWCQRIPGSHEVTGFQADVCDDAYWGCLYDCNRGRMQVQVPQAELAPLLRKRDWNELRIRAQGDRIQIWLNGYRTVDWQETDPEIPRSGAFALQAHQGPPGEVCYRNLRVQRIAAEKDASSKE